MSYEEMEIAVQNSELTREYLPYDSDTWRRAVAQAEREDSEELE